MSINVTLLFPIVHLNVFEIPLKKTHTFSCTVRKEQLI